VNKLPKIIILAGVVSAAMYGLLGMIVPVAIESTPSMISISFRDYSAGYKADSKPWWTYIIEYSIVLFPALDVFSAFPLLSIASNDNII